MIRERYAPWLNLLADLLHSPAGCFISEVIWTSTRSHWNRWCCRISSLPILIRLGPGKRSGSAFTPCSLLHNPSHLKPQPAATVKASNKCIDMWRPNDDRFLEIKLCVFRFTVMLLYRPRSRHRNPSFKFLPHFTCGGSVHLIVNNQIGYTTPAMNARSSVHNLMSEKWYRPLFMSMGFPEDAARATTTLLSPQQTPRKIHIDLIARWLGHNELDEPVSLNPSCIRNIRARKSVPELYETLCLGFYPSRQYI
jgi:probable 2-oxoglutarate dehydrogenase E1 component DHKTD1